MNIELEELESVMCDVINIRLKRRDAARSKIEHKFHPKFGNPSFKIGRSTAALLFSALFLFPLLVASLLFRHMFMTSHMTLSSASIQMHTEIGGENSLANPRLD